MRPLSLLTAALLCSATATLAQEAETLPKPKLLGEIVVPSALSLDGVVFGGISDLDYDADRQRFLAISDDRVQHGPARFYDLGISLEDGVVSLDISPMRELMAPGDSSFAERGADPEGIAISGDRLFWSSERDQDGQPAIYVAAADGSGAEAIALPDAYLPDSEGSKGVYNNLGFEGLTLSTDGSRLFAATENGLMQDGDKATQEAGSPSRLIEIDTETLEPVAEYIYPTQPIFTRPIPQTGWGDNGVSAIAALEDGRLVVVERSFAAGVGNFIAFYLADLSAAGNLMETEGNDPAEVEPVAKTLWFQIAEGDYGLDIDNIESIAFGPVMDGQQSVVIASDDNFNPERQYTQFVVFGIPAE